MLWVLPCQYAAAQHCGVCPDTLNSPSFSDRMVSAILPAAASTDSTRTLTASPTETVSAMFLTTLFYSTMHTRIWSMRAQPCTYMRAMLTAAVPVYPAPRWCTHCELRDVDQAVLLRAEVDERAVSLNSSLRKHADH
eukprot:363869-Chlamydomonas_euryale.AAC.40